MKRLCALSFSVLFALTMTACGTVPIGPNNTETTTSGTVTTTSTTPTTTTTTEPPPPPDITVHALAVGDNLVQTRVYQAAQKYAGDGVSYNFTPCYENVSGLVQAADVAIINQETLICGEGYEISGSNFNFNSPVELGTAMIAAGFDVFTLANNHMLDKGVKGLASSIDYWDGMQSRYGITAVGAYKDEADQSQIRIREVNGLKLAFLSYTEHMNGYKLPADSPLKIGTLDQVDLIRSQIQQAKMEADAVIVSAHWGDEDTHTVRPTVKVLAQQMVEWGADVILGSHSHTAQTMEWLTRPDGTSGFVYYSLGNFISAQTDNFNMIGEIGEFDIVKSGVTGEVVITNVSCAPVITHYDDGKLSNLRLYLYPQYTPELAAGHGVPYAPLGTAKTFGMDVIDRIVNANIPEQFRKLGYEMANPATPPDPSTMTTTTATTTTTAVTTTTTTTASGTELLTSSLATTTTATAWSTTASAWSTTAS